MNQNQAHITDDVICPYPGLRPFTEEESIYFKGRDEHIEKITRILERDKFLMLTGASGDGKSSLVYAGLIPNARAGFFTAKHNEWVIADFRPERTPLLNLSGSINKQLHYGSVETVLGNLKHGYSSLVDLYKNSFICQSNQETHSDGKDKSTKPSNLLILVDQFEELFTNPENYFTGASSEESKTVINLLMETNIIAKQEELPIYIVCTMRSDYISYCTSFRNLPELIGESHYFVPRLNRKEIYQIIKEPAELSGRTISVRLTERLLNDLKEGMEVLPILQHALYKIWQVAQEENSNLLDLIHYAKVGGMSGAELPDQNQEEFNTWFAGLPHFKKQLLFKPSLDNVLNTHSDELFEMSWEYYNRNHPNEPSISNETSKRILKNSFLCLTKVDGSKAIRNRMSVTEITNVIGDKSISQGVVQGVLNLYQEKGNTFIRPFLSSPLKQMQSYWTEIKIGPDTVLDITHEALIRNWKLLRQWVSEEEQSVMIFHDFQIQTNRWVQGGRKKEFLLSEGHLNYFNKWYHKQVPNLHWIKRYIKSPIDQVVTDQPKENGSGNSISTQVLKTEELNVSLVVPKAPNTMEIARVLEGNIREFIGLSSKNIRFKKRLTKYSFVVISCLLLLSTFSFFQTLKEKNNVLLLNRISKSDEISYRSLLVKEDDPTYAFRMAERAYQLYPGINAQKALMASYMQPPFYQMYKVHQNIVNSACFSKDGLTLLSTSKGPAKILDLEGNTLHLLDGHTRNVMNGIYSPDGEHILTYSEDQTAKLWDKNGKLISTLAGHQNDISVAIFSPVENIILTASYDHTAKLWDFYGKNKVTLSGALGPIVHATFSKNGNLILTSSLDGTSTLWNKEGEKLLDLKCSEKLISSDFIQDGKFLFTLSEDSSLIVWNRLGKKIQTIKFNFIPAIMRVSPDEKHLLVSLEDFSLKLFVIDILNQIFPLSLVYDRKIHSDKIREITISKDSKRFVTGSDDMTARLWDMKGNLLYIMKANDLIYDVNFNDEGTHIVTAMNAGTIKLWDIRTVENLVLNGHSAFIWDGVYSLDGKFILTASWDKTAKLWTSQGNLITTLAGHYGEVNFAIFSPDNKFILTTSNDYSAILWDIEGKMITKLKVHNNKLNKAAFSHSGKYFILPSNDKHVSLWAIIDSGKTKVKFVKFLSGHKGRIKTVAFSVDDKYIFTGSEDKTACIWDLSGVLVKTLNFHKEEVFHLGVSPDNKHIALASSDKKASLWTVEGDFVAEFSGHEDVVSNICFSHSGKLVATASMDKTVKLWDMKGNCIKTFLGHSQMVNTVEFSNDDRYILSSSDDKTARLWDINGNNINNYYGHTSGVQSSTFSPNNKNILTTSGDGTARIWPVFISDVLAKINKEKTRGNVWDIPEQEEIQIGLR